MFSIESLIFIISSLISTSLIYFQVPKSALFVFLSILLAILLVFFGKFQLSFLQKKEHRIYLLMALLVCALFIQTLLIATGGFFSAFIIVLHLFTLGMSLLLNVRSSIFFLLISVAVLASMIFFDPQTVVLFGQDPWSFLLHGVSFLVVIPLAHMMVSTYHLKDAITKVLTDHLKTKEMQDESIFRGIGEFVLILSKELRVIFANEALKQSLGLENDQIISKNLFDILPIQETNGGEVNSQTLSIDQAIADRSAHIVRGFYFKAKQGNRKMPVTIQVRPIYEPDGQLKQLILVMTEDKTGSMTDTVDIKLASARRKLLETELEGELKNSTTSLVHYTLLMEQINDALIYEDLQNHGITENKTLTNISDFINHLIVQMQKITTNLGVSVDFIDTQEALVRLATQVSSTEYSLYSHTKKNLLAGIDNIWANQILAALFKLFVLIGSSTNKQVIMRVGANDKDELVTVFAVNCPLDIGFAANDLMIQNYGKLQSHPALQLGSGLEGVIVKKITGDLNYPITLKFDQKSAILTATISFPTTIS